MESEQGLDVEASGSPNLYAAIPGLTNPAPPVPKVEEPREQPSKLRLGSLGSDQTNILIL